MSLMRDSPGRETQVLIISVLIGLFALCGVSILEGGEEHAKHLYCQMLMQLYLLQMFLGAILLSNNINPVSNPVKLRHYPGKPTGYYRK